jgi:hypothetical protein
MRDDQIAGQQRLVQTRVDEPFEVDPMGLVDLPVQDPVSKEDEAARVPKGPGD